MNDKIQALAEKIYKDGVEKATGEADRIIASAEAKKEEILSEARSEADAILKKANDSAQKTKERTDGEIQMSLNSAREALETEITDILTSQAVTKGVDEALATPDKLYNIIVKMSEEMIRQNGNGIKISTADSEELTAYFKEKAADLLEKGVEITHVQGTPATFQIAPKTGDYKLSISKEAFVNYFKEFLRPNLRALLFPNDRQSTEA